MFFQGVGCGEATLLRSNKTVVVNAHFRIFHKLALRTVQVKTIVCPEGAAQKPHSAEVSYVVVQESNRGAFSSLRHVDPGLVKGL